MADVPTEVYYKIIVVGESGAGKTSFVRKLVHGAFTFAYKVCSFLITYTGYSLLLYPATGP